MIRFNKYIKDVQSGEVDVCEYIKLAISRHLRDLENPLFYFDTAQAQKIISFAEVCRHWKGEKAGKRIELEPHQVFYLGSLFGWKRKDGLRRFRVSYKEVARKSYKTTECAVKAIYHVVFDTRRR